MGILYTASTAAQTNAAALVFLVFAIFFTPLLVFYTAVINYIIRDFAITVNKEICFGG